MDTALPLMLTRARQLLTEAGLDALLPEWHQLFAHLNERAFTVAVAGEFSRGKSTLVNRLLDADVVPVGDLPTTAMLTRVHHGKEPALWRIHSDGRRERLHLTPEISEELVADDSGRDPEGSVEVEVPYPWLEQTGIQLFDTPGAGDLAETRGALATAALAASDAALVAVGATMAMSQTERAFVEEHVLARKVPHVAVVLTRLDQVPETERPRVLAYTCERLHDWAPAAVLWCAHGPPVLPAGAPVEAAGPEAIRERLAAWAADPEQERLRILQVAVQLLDLVEVLRAALADRLQAAALSVGERQKALQAALGEMERTRLDWEDLRLEMDRRDLAAFTWLEESIRKGRDDLHEQLTHGLRSAAQVKDWWSTELPYLLRRRLLRLTAEKALGRFLIHERGKIKLLQPARELTRAVRVALHEVLPAQRRLFEDDLSNLQQRYAAKKPELDGAERHRAQILERMQRHCDRLRQDVGHAVEARVAELASLLPGWAKDLQPQNTIQFLKFEGMVPQGFVTQTKRLVEEVVPLLSARLEQEQAVWQRDKLQPLVQARLTEMSQDVTAPLETFLAGLDTIKADLSGVQAEQALGEERIGGLERVLAAAGGLLIGGAGSALVGATMGYKEMLKSLGPQIALVVGMMLIVGFNQMMLLPILLAAGIVQGFWKTRSTTEKVKVKVAEDMAARLRAQAPETAERLATQVREQAEKLVQTINRGMEKEIQSVREQIEPVIAAKKAGEERVETQRQALAGAETQLKEIDAALCDMILAVAGLPR